MIKEKTRDQIDNKDKWDLNTVYVNDDLWQKGYDLVLKDLKKKFKN